VFKEAILRKFQGLAQTAAPSSKEEVDEIRLTIKLMIHAFKSEAVFAFQEYTKLILALPVSVLVAPGPVRPLSSLLL